MKQTMHSQQGATLIEALVAILIFSIGILAVVGLQALSVRAVSDARYRADASFLANQALGRLWGDPDNLVNYVQANVPVNELPSGQRNVAIDGRRATVTINWQPPGDPSVHTFVVEGIINANN